MGKKLDLSELVHPSCRYCKRILYHKTGLPEKKLPRFFCLGKRDTTLADSVDDHNFCIYSPYKGVVQFQIYHGDLELWYALFHTAVEEISGKVPSNLGWLKEMKRNMKASAKIVKFKYGV